MTYNYLFVFFNDTATTEIYTLSLHDALPIYLPGQWQHGAASVGGCRHGPPPSAARYSGPRLAKPTWRDPCPTEAWSWAGRWDAESQAHHRWHSQANSERSSCPPRPRAP